MARITGKNAQILCETTRTVVSSEQTMTDLGAHTIYQYQSFWDPTYPPVLTRQIHGSGAHNLVAYSLYTVDYINGKVTFTTPNNSDDVIRVNIIQWTTVVAVSDVHDWTIDAKIDVVDVTGFQDAYKTKLSAFREWNGSAQSYHNSLFWFPLWSAANACYVKFFPDAAQTECFIGAAFISFSQKAPMSGAVADAVKLDGTGALTRVA